MNKQSGIGGLWLTLNRACNFRCLWCYGQGTEFSPDEVMDFEMARSLFDLGHGLGTSSVILIGGEPTLWKPLPELIKYMNAVGVEPIVVTNGLRFSRMDFLDEFYGSTFSLSLSLKAVNRQRHIELTGKDKVDDVKRSMRNLRLRGIPFTVSITVSNLVLDDVSEMISAAVENGAPSVSLEFCAVTFDQEGNPCSRFMVEPHKLASSIVNKYERWNECANGRLSIQLSLPLCLFPEVFLEKLNVRGQMTSGCHVLRREGIIFDPYGKLLMCNCLHHIQLGKFGNEFLDSLSFMEFWKRRDIVEVNEQLITFPASRCISCKQYGMCGGGCPLQWFCFNPADVIPNSAKEV